MKTVLITGATSGIGRALAERLSQRGRYRLVLCGRRQEVLDALQRDLSAFAEITTLTFDVADRAAAEAAFQGLPPNFSTIDVLVNNAGNAHGLDPVHEASIADWDRMIDSNLRGLLYLTHLVVPGMVTRQSGQVINVGSIAGKEAYPNGSVYCATKAAVDVFTQGMRMDLHAHGIRVAAVHPGMVATDFSLIRFKGDETKASQVYANTQPLTAYDVAEVMRLMIEAPAHVNFADVLLLPAAQASATRVHRSPAALS
jgi:3-hydroxy acid dehydrogenase / malonic semialdehyde reductase